MKPDYKNWMPKGMIYGSAAVTLLFLILFIHFRMYRHHQRRAENCIVHRTAHIDVARLRDHRMDGIDVPRVFLRW